MCASAKRDRDRKKDAHGEKCKWSAANERCTRARVRAFVPSFLRSFVRSFSARERYVRRTPFLIVLRFSIRAPIFAVRRFSQCSDFLSAPIFVARHPDDATRSTSARR